MSASFLPLLCPVVSKAPVLALRPKQKLPTPGQQALFTLLKQRHERYLTQKESKAADPSAAHDWSKQTVYSPTAGLIQYGGGCGIPYSPTGNLKGTSATNLFSDLGCSDLAEHVVHRAKVRLKKRHQKRVLSLRSKRTPFCEANPEVLNCPDSQNMLLLAVGDQNTQQQLRPSMHSTKNSSGPIDHRKDFKSADVLSSLESPTRVSMLPEAEFYASASPGLSSLAMQLHPKRAEHSTNEDDKPKLRVVYLSERQSGTSKITDIPDAPPVTPNEAYKHTHSFKYVPSLHDIKSQRLLKTRLQEMTTKAKEGSLQTSQAAKEEERKQKEMVAKLKAQQRAEIYALNKIMTEYEEQKFQDSLSVKV